MIISSEQWTSFERSATPGTHRRMSVDQITPFKQGYRRQQTLPPVRKLMPLYTTTSSNSVAWRPPANTLEIYDYVLQHNAPTTLMPLTQDGRMRRNMTSSTKPEVHNVLHCCRRRAKSPTRNTNRKLDEVRTCI